MNWHILVGGEVLYIFSFHKCGEHGCCIHKPSDHHMVNWSQHYDDNIHLMMRLCEHGHPHPDPDDYFIEYRVGFIHSCDGCCNPFKNLKIEDIIADLYRIKKDLER